MSFFLSMYLILSPRKSIEAFIPNLEVSDEFKNAVEDSEWEYISNNITKRKQDCDFNASQI